MILSSLIASTGPVIHIAPGGVLNIDGVNITNSILYGWMCSIVIIVVLTIVARVITVKPKGGLVQFVEAGVSFIDDMVTGAFDDKSIAAKYSPYFVTLFFFILFNNWLGLLPIVGEGLQSNHFPLLRPFTAD